MRKSFCIWKKKKMQFLAAFKTDEEHPEDMPQRYERLKEVVGILDGMLENQDYVAGRNLTIADLSIIAEIVGLQVHHRSSLPEQKLFCERSIHIDKTNFSFSLFSLFTMICIYLIFIWIFFARLKLKKKIFFYIACMSGK